MIDWKKSSVIFTMERNEEKSLRKEFELPETDKELYETISKDDPYLAKLWLSNVRVGDDGKVYVPGDIVGKRVKKHFGDPIREFLESKGIFVNLTYIVHKGLRPRQKDIPFGNLETLANETPKDVNSELDKKRLFDSVVSQTDYPRDEGELVIHRGNLDAVRGLNLISDGVLNGNMKAKQYVIFGNNSAGKTALASYAVKNFLSEEVSVSYVEVNKLVRWLNNSNGAGGSPSYVHAAYDANVIIFDELGKICRADGKIHPGTQKRVRNILDHANEKNVPVIMLYTGNMSRYEKMLRNLKSQNGNKWGEDIARDLGSRLERIIPIWVKKLGDSDRLGFIGKYLKQENAPINLNLEGAIKGIYDTLLPNPSIRRIMGCVDSAIFKARCNQDKKIGYEEVVNLLGKSEQQKMFERYREAEDALKKVAEYTGVSESDIKSGGRFENIANARALTTWVSHYEIGASRDEIADLFGKTYGFVAHSVKRVDNVLKLEESELNPKQRELKRLVEGYKSRQE